MEVNLGLSFYDKPMSPSEIDMLETRLIALEIPVLNISKNPENKYKEEISFLRKLCVDIIKSHLGIKNVHSHQKTKGIIKSVPSRSNPINKYKLHEAIEIVLLQFSSNTATTKEISDIIWEERLYVKKDGGKAMPSQIFLRSKNYSQFELLGREKVKLIRKTL